MLNTQSRLTSLIVWLAIAAICGGALWTVLGLPPLLAMLRAIQDSEFSAVATRNPVLFAGLLGFGGLALAFLLNGWRDRAERRHVHERAEKRLAAVLSHEARSLAESLVALAGATADGNPRARWAELAEPADSLLMGLSSLELSRLGPGATTAVQAVRRTMRRVAQVSAGRDEAAWRQLMPQVLEAAIAARGAARVLDRLSIAGPKAADQMRLLPPSESDIAELARRLSDVPASARLLTAA